MRTASRVCVGIVAFTAVCGSVAAQSALEASPAAVAALNDQPRVPMQPATLDGTIRFAASAAGAGSGTGNAPPPKTEAGSSEASAAPSVTAVEPVLMPDTPSGTGDPNTIVCRAPQRIAGSDQFGPKACGHNYEWRKLAMNGKDLAPDGKTLIARPTVANPEGEGNPDAVTCRTPQFVTLGPLVEVCRPNRFWADLIKNHQIADANGAVVTPRPPVMSLLPCSPGFYFGTSCYPDPGGNAPGAPTNQMEWEPLRP